MLRAFRHNSRHGKLRSPACPHDIEEGLFCCVLYLTLPYLNNPPTPHARDTHTTHDDTTGPEGGDCMLVGGCCGGPSQELRLLTPTVASPPSRTASTSLTLRPLPMKAQPPARWRSSKTRQKLTPRVFAPLEILPRSCRDVSDLCRSLAFWPLALSDGDHHHPRQPRRSSSSRTLIIRLGDLWIVQQALRHARRLQVHACSRWHVCGL